jgi:hypothetical protein
MSPAELDRLIAERDQLRAEKAQLAARLRGFEDEPTRLRDLSTNAVHQVARYYAAAEATIHGQRAEINTPRTLVDINGKSAQVLGKRRSGAWQIDRNPPLDERAEFVIFVDLGSAPSAFYIASAIDVGEGIQTRLTNFKERHGGQRPRNPRSFHSEIRLEHIQQWRDRWDLLQ